MSDGPAKDSLINKSPGSTFNPDRPWPWVSYDDPAWPLAPWELANDEDLADAAVRLAIWYLRGSTGNMSTLRSAALVEDAARRVISDVVAEARTRRYSWGRIAAEFQVGRTAAQKRFGKHPDDTRVMELEDQYVRMGHFLHSAELNPGEYEDEEEVRETRARCIRRRRGHVIDPLDNLHKVAPRRHVDHGPERQPGTQ